MQEEIAKIDKYLESQDYDSSERKRFYEKLIEKCNKEIDMDLFQAEKGEIDDFETEEISDIDPDEDENEILEDEEEDEEEESTEEFYPDDQEEPENNTDEVKPIEQLKDEIQPLQTLNDEKQESEESLNEEISDVLKESLENNDGSFRKRKSPIKHRKTKLNKGE